MFPLVPTGSQAQVTYNPASPAPVQEQEVVTPPTAGQVQSESQPTTTGIMLMIAHEINRYSFMLESLLAVVKGVYRLDPNSLIISFSSTTCINFST